MVKRAPASVFALSFIFSWFYRFYWLYSTKEEIEEFGVPQHSIWLCILPFVSVAWDWEYSKGVEKITGGKMKHWVCFLLLQTQLIVMLIFLIFFAPFDTNKLTEAFSSYRGTLFGLGAILLAVLQSFFNKVAWESTLERNERLEMEENERKIQEKRNALLAAAEASKKTTTSSV